MPLLSAALLVCHPLHCFHPPHIMLQVQVLEAEAEAEGEAEVQVLQAR